MHLLIIIALSIYAIWATFAIVRAGDISHELTQEINRLRSAHRREIRLSEGRIAFLESQLDQLKAERRGSNGHGWGC